MFIVRGLRDDITVEDNYNVAEINVSIISPKLIILTLVVTLWLLAEMCLKV